MMNLSTHFAQGANNILSVLQEYTKGIRLLLVVLLTLTASTAWGATTTYTFTSKSWADSSNGWTSTKDGNQFTENQGVQVTTGVSDANATTKASFTNISKIEVQYCTNASKGAGSIGIQVGNNTAKSVSVTKPSSGGTTLKTATFTFDPNETGAVKITVTCTTNSIYIYSVTITTIESVTPSVPYTVTLDAGTGSVTDTERTEASAGAGVELPEATICEGWTFAGWAESSVDEETTTEPTLIPVGKYKPTSDITLYAVYSRTEESEGTTTAEDKKYSHSITSKTWSENGTITLTDVSWTLDNDGDYFGYDGTKGQQVGSGKSPAKSMTLTTSGFANATKITAVRISTSGASSINGTVSVKVGSTSYTYDSETTATLTSSDTEYEFTGNSTGDITISWAQTSSKAIYFKKIEVDYQISSGSGSTSTTYYHSSPECSEETAVSSIPKNALFGQAIFGLNTAYPRLDF